MIKPAQTIPVSDFERAWVDQWGECVTKSKAAKMMGVDRSTIYIMIQDGRLKTSPSGMVLVRPAARWANGA